MESFKWSVEKSLASRELWFYTEPSTVNEERRETPVSQSVSRTAALAHMPTNRDRVVAVVSWLSVLGSIPDIHMTTIMVSHNSRADNVWQQRRIQIDEIV